ncbi:MAG: UvrD-helicase domain-containing protein [Oscillospiraceae bacterium]|nr:UvrD-helicase domain-containing protein [Oscillospiraceae bacterium]
MDASFEKRYIAARRKVIENDFKNLNPEQRKAVMTTEGPLLLLAGAGSGKTTVLINRIVNLMRYGSASDSTEIPDYASEEDIQIMDACMGDISRRVAALDPVEPWRIIAITFTNKAAGELKARLERALGEGANEIWAQTFHSACVRILRRDADRIGFTRSFTIYDTADCQSLMKRIIKDFDLDEKMFPFRYVLSVISKAKDEMLTPEQYYIEAKKSYDVRKTKVAELYAEYAKRLREADAMDFDDLILNAVILLQQNEDIRDYYQRKFKYVLVDEYQDTNNLQYLLASTLAGGYENICVVGDDDQSIYKFRGATIKNILDFESQYKHARVIKLEQNYRSTGHILEAANAVISNNRGRKGKRLWTAADMGDKPVLHVAPNENEEAQYVADRILENFSAGTNWGEHVVLYRMNAQSNALEYAFKRRGIPYRIFGGTKFFDRAEVKDMLAYLNVIMNPADDLRLLRIINTPARGIGATSVEKAVQIAAEKGICIFEVVKNADQYTELQRSAVRLRQFAVMIDELRALADSIPADELYDAVVERTGYIRSLQEKSTPDTDARIENVKELKSNIINYIKESGDGSLHGFLDEVALYTDLDNMDKEADCVVMMTIHSAKGLEFPNVFLVGAEEGIFPGMRAIGEHEEMEEERRLCYVAITRAMKKLYISCATQRMLFGRTSANRVSRFVEEIPDEHIQKSYIPKGYSFSDKPRGFEDIQKPAHKNIRPIVTPNTAKAEPPSFRKGDMVNHRSFGNGMIMSMTPMGGDHLVEIAFDKVGTKRLMLKAASKLMTKV